MIKVVEKLKKMDRTVLEVSTALLFWMLCLMLIFLMIPSGKLDQLAETIRLSYPPGSTKGVWSLNLFVPALLALGFTVHMKHRLDTALQFDAKSATSIIFKGYFFRYLILALLAILAARFGILNPVLLILAYVLYMKAAVYSQPLSHKLYNRLFHEEDPVPHALEESVEQ